MQTLIFHSRKDLLFGRGTLIIAMIFMAVAGLATLSSSASASDEIDPLIGFNRTTHEINESLDSAVLKPAAQTYKAVTPDFLEHRVDDFLENLDDVGVTINDLLQFKFLQAAHDSGRLLINSTIGLAGLFDVADAAFGMEKHHEDFGQTLGYWGVGSGLYLELPLLGPTTARGSAGMIIDTLLNPTNFLGGGAQGALVAGDAVHSRAALLDVEALMSGDDYVFMREAYLQHREFLVNDGEVEDSFADFESDFE